MMRMKRLSGQAAIITGAANGIGRAIATAFLDEGAKVLNMDVAHSPEDSFKEFASSYRYFQGDISKPAECRAAVGHAIKEFGKLTILINNAAVSFPGFTDGPDSLELWNRALGINLTGAFQMIHFALPHFKSSGEPAAILNVSSIAAQVINPAIHPGYAASKGGINSLTKFLAAAYAKYDIRCNSISPAGVKTALWFSLPEEVQSKYERLHPLGTGEPADIASLAVFLCSAEAKWITGADFLIDGGNLCACGLAQEAKERF